MQHSMSFPLAAARVQTAYGRNSFPRSSSSLPRLLFVGAYVTEAFGSRAISEDLAEHLMSEGWSITFTSRSRSRYVRVLDMLGTVWRERHSYDVGHVDVYGGAAFRWAEAVCQALRATGKPYVLTLHGGSLPALARRSPKRATNLLKGANAVTTPSRYLGDALRRFRSDVHLLPNALEPDNYPFRLRERPEPRLLWLRTFHSQYNPTLAPHVIARLADEFPTAELTMVGPDKDGSLERTRIEADRVGVIGRIAMVGGVPKTQVPQYLAAGDIFLNTTNVDNCPVSVLEAMATGLCIVSTNVGGIPHLLDDNRDALLVPVGDSEAMAAAVRRILTESGLAARLSRNARAKAERFAWRRILPQWQELLLDVARCSARSRT